MVPEIGGSANASRRRSAGRGRDDVVVLLLPRAAAVGGGQDGVDRRRSPLGADDPADVGRQETERGGAEQTLDGAGRAEGPATVAGEADGQSVGGPGPRGERRQHGGGGVEGVPGSPGRAAGPGGDSRGGRPGL